MKIPEKIRLAIDVIGTLRLVTDGTPRRVEDLAVTLGTSKNFLHQVVCKLSKAKMVSVVKGPKGGLFTTMAEPTLLDIFRLFDYMDEPIVGNLPSSAIESELRKLLDGISI